MAKLVQMSTLVTLCKQYSDKEASTHIGDPEWKSRISNKYGDLWSTVSGTGLRYFETSTTITATGATSYQEPADIDSTVLITRVLTDGRELQIDPLEAPEEGALKGRTGDAWRFSLIDDQLYLYPKPSSGTYKWYYRQQPTDLSAYDDSQLVDVCCAYGLQFLIWGVVADALPKSDGDPAYAAMQASKYEDKLMNWAVDRLSLESPRQLVRVLDALPWDSAEYFYR